MNVSNMMPRLIVIALAIKIKLTNQTTNPIIFFLKMLTLSNVREILVNFIANATDKKI